MKKYLKTIMLLLIIIVIGLGAFFGKIFIKEPNKPVADIQATDIQPADAQPTATETPEATRAPLTPEQLQQHVDELLLKATVKPNENPVVGVGTGTDFDAVTRKAVENAGGLKEIIKKGDSVLIKPNMITMARPAEGIITDYRVVQSLVDQALEAGAAKVYVGDGSPWGRVLQNSMCKYTELTNCEIVDFNDFKKEDCYQLRPLNPILPKQIYNIPKIYMDADVVISAAKLKTHAEGVVTLTLKNAFGIPPMGSARIGVGKTYLHTNGIPNSIVELNLIRKPEFVVIDGIIGGEGRGPIRSTPVDSQVVFASLDPVACDMVGLTFMGFQLSEVPHVSLAEEHGLGIADLSKISVNGANLDEIKMSFEHALGY